MVSKAEEEVRKRRAKEKPGSSRVYTKLVLLGAVIGVLLAVGLSPRMAPMLSAGIIGFAVLAFFWLKKHPPREKKVEKPVPAEAAPLPIPEEAAPSPILLEAEEKELSLEEGLEEPAAPAPEIFSEKKAEEPEASTLQRIPAPVSPSPVEERLAFLEERLARLEEKVAEIQETNQADGKVDLQKIFSQIDENSAKKSKSQRSYLVQTEDPVP